MTRTVLRTAVDAWIDENNAADNHGNTAKLRVRDDSGSGDENRALVFFARAVPPSPYSVIDEAILHTYLATDRSGSVTLTAKRVTSRWSEDEVDWDSKPTSSATHQATASFTDGEEDDEVSFDVTDMLADVLGGSSWWGVEVSSSSTSLTQLHSADTLSDGKKPWLEVTWERTPHPPTDLKPSDGHVVSDSRPTVVWTSVDEDGTAVQASAQVQVNSTSTGFDADTGWASPDFDSGEVTGPEQEMDLGDQGLSALTAGDVWYWSVRWRNGQGHWSQYADPVSFSYRALPTLTLVNPGSTVEETTPPVDWTIDSGNQARRWVRLFRTTTTKGWGEDYGQEYGGAGWELIYEWPKAATGVTRVTIPPHLLKLIRENAYKIRVSVTDSRDREALPGAPIWAMVEQEFTLDETSTADPVDTLTAVTHDWGIRLTWTRAAQPDFWGIKVGTDDGDTYVVDRLDGDEPFVTGTTYRYDVNAPELTPGVEQTFEVVPIVADGGVRKHVPSNPTVTTSFRPLGIWLVEQESQVAIQLEDVQPPTIEVPASAGEHFPLGSRKGVSIVDAVRGYEGRMGGVVVGATYRRRFERYMANLPDTLYWLIWVDVVLSVELKAGEFRGPTPRNVAGPDPVFDVEFGFREAADYRVHLRS